MSMQVIYQLIIYSINMTFQRELKTCQVREFDFDGLRSKRAIQMELSQSDGSYFVPLYTQLTVSSLDNGK